MMLTANKLKGRGTCDSPLLHFITLIRTYLIQDFILLDDKEKLFLKIALKNYLKKQTHNRLREKSILSIQKDKY